MCHYLDTVHIDICIRENVSLSNLPWDFILTRNSFVNFQLDTTTSCSSLYKLFGRNIGDKLWFSIGFIMIYTSYTLTKMELEECTKPNVCYLKITLSALRPFSKSYQKNKNVTICQIQPTMDHRLSNFIDQTWNENNTETGRFQ